MTTVMDGGRRGSTSVAPPRLLWAEYGIEAAAVAAFIVSAIAFTATLEHPASAVHRWLPDALVRRALMGVAMGLTAAAITYSPWGQRSGAHLNPVVTFTFLRLGKISRRDACGYGVAQFAGGTLGLVLGLAIAGNVTSHPAVNYVATLPGPSGPAAAFAGELTISFLMMSMILRVTNTPRLAHLTGAIAACLIAVYITFEAPLSGMSMNPARSLAPGAAAHAWGSLWIYFTAPAAGMLLAAELYVRRYGLDAVRCAKLHHPAHLACHFNCRMRPGDLAIAPRTQSHSTLVSPTARPSERHS